MTGDFIGATINLLNTCTLLMGRFGVSPHSWFDIPSAPHQQQHCRCIQNELQALLRLLDRTHRTHTHTHRCMSAHSHLFVLSAHTCSHSNSFNLLCWKVTAHTHAPCFFMFTTHTSHIFIKFIWTDSCTLIFHGSLVSLPFSPSLLSWSTEVWASPAVCLLSWTEPWVPGTCALIGEFASLRQF